MRPYILYIARDLIELIRGEGEDETQQIRRRRTLN